MQTAIVCAFLVRYLRWLYLGVATAECCSQQSQKMAPFTERLLLVLERVFMTRHHTGQQDPGDFEETPRPWTLVEGTTPCGQTDRWPCVHSAFAEVVGKALCKYLAPNVVSPLCLWRDVEDCLLHRENGRASPSQHSQSVNRAASSVHQHLTPASPPPQNFTVTHIWVWHFSSSLYLFVNNKTHTTARCYFRVLFLIASSEVWKRIPLLNNLLELERSEYFSRRECNINHRGGINLPCCSEF